MEQRNIIILVALILICGAVVAGLFAKVPTAAVSGAAISSFNLSSIGLNITLDIGSPYPVAVPIQSIRYTVTYQGKNSHILLGEGEQRGIILQPGAQKLVIPLVISNPSLIRSVYETLQTRQIPLTISGNITFDLFGITPRVPFKENVTVPVPNTVQSVIAGIGSFAGRILQ